MANFKHILIFCLNMFTDYSVYHVKISSLLLYKYRPMAFFILNSTH